VAESKPVARGSLAVQELRVQALAARAVKTDADALKGEIAVLRADNDRLRARIDASMPERVDTVVAALRLVPGLWWQGKTNDEIRREVLLELGYRVDGDEERVAGQFAIVAGR
jgi:hypothetical protein